MLKIEKLYKNFNDLKVLKNINIQVNKGERVVIIGPSGSGKSTLLRCINYMEIPTKGKISFDNQVLNDKNIDKYRQKIGMVFQSFNLFNNLTVLDNLILAPVKIMNMSYDDAKKKAIDYLKRIDLVDKMNVYPSSLSGGQKQRVAIVRTMMMNPEMILFDEPTSALDPEMVKGVQDMMLELANLGMTMVIVTHELSFIKKVATKIMFMDNGEIKFSGTYEEIKKCDNGIIKTFLSNIE